MEDIDLSVSDLGPLYTWGPGTKRAQSGEDGQFRVFGCLRGWTIPTQLNPRTMNELSQDRFVTQTLIIRQTTKLLFKRVVV